MMELQTWSQLDEKEPCRDTRLNVGSLDMVVAILGCSHGASFVPLSMLGDIITSHR